MADEQNRSPAGSPILRHEARQRRFPDGGVAGDPVTIEVVDRHFAEHIAPPQMVFHAFDALGIIDVINPKRVNVVTGR